MRIYLAARFDRSAEMLDVAAALSQLGHFVTSRWIYGRTNAPDLLSAIEDIEDLTDADCLVSFTEHPTKGVAWAARGGRHVEFGVALATSKRLCIVGPRENIFHHLPRVEVYRSLAELLDVLAPNSERP
ncbi:MAG TPA: hypothetical protein VHJ20_01070 [Polyangia bacterium]|nr:hypothetical protein [Polyangia bacterium]